MSIMTCTSDCVHQDEGCCTLSRAAGFGAPSEANPCINYMPARPRRSAEPSPGAPRALP